MAPIEYVSHAHTPEEMLAEVISDLHRRIAALEGYSDIIAKSATERAKLARGVEELHNMLKYWSNVKIVRPRSKRELAREARKGEGISGSVTLPHIPSRPPSEH